MPVMIMAREGNSQIGSCANLNAAYVTAPDNLSFATGIKFLARMKNRLPRGATVNSATLSMQVSAKNAATAQTIYNSFRAHASGDSPILTPGVAEAQRAWTSTSVPWTMAWPVNPPGNVIANIDVKPLLNEVMSRSDYQPGGYLTFQMTTDNENGSDMSVRANYAFSQTWELAVDYTENYTDLKTTINLAANANFEPLPQISADPVPFWAQTSYFGTFVDAANQGTLARDVNFTRLPGVPTLRFTCGTPPTDNPTRTTGPHTTSLMQTQFPYIFAGWIYIPAAITTQVSCGDPYLGKSHIVTARDQWVPFCSTPSNLGETRGTFWPAIGIKGPFQAGWQVWISEPTILQSSFRQMPFGAGTPSVTDPGGSILVQHKRVGSGQNAVREWVPRTVIKRDGLQRRAPRFIRRADGILQLAEPIKGGPQVQALPGTLTAATFPAGKTFAEL